MEKCIVPCEVCNHFMEKKSAKHKKCVICSGKSKPKITIHDKIECVNCKYIFEPTNSNQKICSKDCGKKYDTMRINDKWQTKEPSRKCRSRVSQCKLNFYD